MKTWWSRWLKVSIDSSVADANACGDAAVVDVDVDGGPKTFL
jgi:hypothetical protein